LVASPELKKQYDDKVTLLKAVDGKYGRWAATSRPGDLLSGSSKAGTTTAPQRD
jgi:hypothetical protein